MENQNQNETEILPLRRNTPVSAHVSGSEPWAETPAVTLEANEDFLASRNNQPLLVACAVMASVYFGLITFFFPRGNLVLFYLLIAGEVFHLWQTLTYCLTVWDMEYKAPFRRSFKPGVDVFITVAGEPVEIVKETLLAAKKIRYPNFNVFILNDGFVAKKDNWKDIEKLAKRHRVGCITRTVAGGAKAGNINNALSLTNQPFVAIFDADHVPHPDFLEKTMGYFADPAMAVVQTPQFYKNYSSNQVTDGAWGQQELFFGAICRGKNKSNSVFMCGTNMIIRREALVEAQGMREESITEDFVTSLHMHQRGWRSFYVAEVLAEGLAPEDIFSYSSQQMRWARGALEILFKDNPLFKKGLTWAQRIQYLASASFFLSGLVVLIDAILPIVFFFTGQVAIRTSTMTLAAFFLPYIFLAVAVLIETSNYSLTSRALAFSMGSFYIHIKALFSILSGRRASFSITSKKRLSGNFIRFVMPHILYIALVVAGVVYAIDRQGLTASVITNFAWAMFNCVMFFYFIQGALQQAEKAVPAAVPETAGAAVAEELAPEIIETDEGEALGAPSEAIL